MSSCKYCDYILNEFLSVDNEKLESRKCSSFEIEIPSVSSQDTRYWWMMPNIEKESQIFNWFKLVLLLAIYYY